MDMIFRVRVERRVETDREGLGTGGKLVTLTFIGKKSYLFW